MSAQAAVEPVERPKETWTYMGHRRVNDTLYAAWKDANGKTLLYDKKRGDAIIGQQYELEVERDDESGISVYFRSKRFIGPVEPEQVSEWRAEAAQAESADQYDRAEAKLIKENGDIGSLTLDDVRRMLRNRKGWKNRTTLLAVVQAYLSS